MPDGIACVYPAYLVFLTPSEGKAGVSMLASFFARETKQAIDPLLKIRNMVEDPTAIVIELATLLRNLDPRMQQRQEEEFVENCLANSNSLFIRVDRIRGLHTASGITTGNYVTIATIDGPIVICENVGQTVSWGDKHGRITSLVQGLEWLLGQQR
jgi:hypothetical protein